MLDDPTENEVLVRMLASGVCPRTCTSSTANGVTRRRSSARTRGMRHRRGDRAGRHDPARVRWWSWTGSRRAGDARTASGRPWTCRRTRSLENVLPDGTTRLHAPTARRSCPTFSSRRSRAPRWCPPPRRSRSRTVSPRGRRADRMLRYYRRSAPSGERRIATGFADGRLRSQRRRAVGRDGPGAGRSGPIVAVDRVASKLELARSVGAPTPCSPRLPTPRSTRFGGRPVAARCSRSRRSACAPRRAGDRFAPSGRYGRARGDDPGRIARVRCVRRGRPEPLDRGDELRERGPSG